MMAGANVPRAFLVDNERMPFLIKSISKTIFDSYESFSYCVVMKFCNI